MKKYFITGPGTGIGKTFYTAKWIRELRSKGKNIMALKPVISGFEPEAIEKTDTGILLAALGLEYSQINIDRVSPWRFSSPISPDMAAEDEKHNFSLQEIVTFCNRYQGYDYLLIEGAGGVMTPMGTEFTNLDVIEQTRSEVVMVCGSYLGAISHTLTALSVLLAKNIPVHAIVLNESLEQPVPTQRTLLTLQRFLPKNMNTQLIISHRI